MQPNFAVSETQKSDKNYSGNNPEVAQDNDIAADWFRSSEPLDILLRQMSMLA